MNKTLSALLIKFAITLGAAYIVFALFGTGTFGFVLSVAVAATGINYLIGDVLILRNFGNTTASIADGGLSILIAYGLAAIIYGVQATATAFIAFGVILGLAEFFFHKFLLRNDEPETDASYNRREPTFNMEMGDEFTDDEINGTLSQDNEPNDNESLNNEQVDSNLDENKQDDRE